MNHFSSHRDRDAVTSQEVQAMLRQWMVEDSQLLADQLSEPPAPEPMRPGLRSFVHKLFGSRPRAGQ